MRNLALRFESLRRHSNPLPRRAAAIGLIVGGVFGFLPILGFWMIPLGVVLLSDDVPWLRRQRRAQTVRWGRWWGRQRERLANGSGRSGQ